MIETVLPFTIGFVGGSTAIWAIYHWSRLWKPSRIPSFILPDDTIISEQTPESTFDWPANELHVVSSGDFTASMTLPETTTGSGIG